MSFGHEKILPGNFLEFVGNGIGMPMQSGNKIFEIWVTRNLVTQRIPGEMLDQYYLFVSVASSGSCPCIR